MVHVDYCEKFIVVYTDNFSFILSIYEFIKKKKLTQDGNLNSSGTVFLVKQLLKGAYEIFSNFHNRRPYGRIELGPFRS